MIFLMLIHIVTCLWIVIATLYDETLKETWMSTYEVTMDELDKGEVYLRSTYWTISTITTVGYGDISGTNPLEEGFCAIIMICGVISFSFANGSLASIIQNFD